MNASELMALLHYDPDTGIFTWRVKPSRRVVVGAVAGALRKKDGYIVVMIARVPYYAHRLAWFYVTGVWPLVEIDHRNTVRSDNRFENLREACGFPNQQNMRKATRRSSTGVLGVFPSGNTGTRFKASVRFARKNFGLGTFGSKAEAHEAYVAAKRILHPGCTL